MLPWEFSLRCTASHPKAKVASGNNVVHMGRSYSRAKPLPCESPASQCDVLWRLSPGHWICCKSISTHVIELQ